MLLAQQKSIIGANIRYFRLVKGYTLSQLAKKAECSESLLSKIENGKATPSLSLLLRIAHALDTTVGQIFNSDTRVHDPVLRHDSRPPIDPDKFAEVEKTRVEGLSPFFEGRLLQAQLLTIEPGGRTLTDDPHPGEIFGFLLAGKLELNIDGETSVLIAGDSFQFRAEQSHGFRNPARSPARIIWVNTPPTL